MNYKQQSLLKGKRFHWVHLSVAGMRENPCGVYGRVLIKLGTDEPELGSLTLLFVPKLLIVKRSEYRQSESNDSF